MRYLQGRKSHRDTETRRFYKLCVSPAHLAGAGCDSVAKFLKINL